MKRFLATMLAAILVIACLAGTVLAADTASVYGSTATTVAGGTANVTFSITEANFASYSMKISYDKEVLTLQNISKVGGSGMLAHSVETGKIAYAHSANETVSGGLFTATFAVSADAKPGTYPVSITISHVSEAGLDALTVSASDGYVVIEEPACEHDWVLIDSKASTCIENGYEVYECSKCRETYTVTLDLAAHTLNAVWAFDGFKHWHVCDVCGQEFDHEDHGDWEYHVIKEATNEEDGLMEVHCGVCDYFFKKIIDKNKDPLPPTGDPTAVIALGTAAVVTLAGTSLYVFKRKTGK